VILHCIAPRRWRALLRTAKTEALRKQVQIIEQNHERDLQRKDAILQMLDRDLEEAEDQYQIILRSHLSNVDLVLGLHKDRMRALELAFRSQVQKLQADFQREKEIVSAKFNAEKIDLEAVIAAIDKEDTDRDTEVLLLHYTVVQSSCYSCFIVEDAV
jgi:dynein regulatory complex subunit 2